MIDFRYLITTIVAIFLALAIGLLIGSGLLADELAEDLERQVQDVVDRNNELRAEITEQGARIDSAEDFALRTEPLLIQGDLGRDSIVLFRFEGTDDALVDRVRDSVRVAEGSIATTITITDRMSMSDADAATELRAGLPPEIEGQGDLARIVGSEMGERAVAAASGSVEEARFEELSTVLEEYGFIDVESDRDFPIPLSAGFVVAGGADGPPPYDLEVFSQALLSGLAGGSADVVAVEGWRSDWDFVPSLRDSEVRDVVATVDHADMVAGSVSMVYELSRVATGEPGHYGFRSGSEGVAPEPLPSD